MYVLGLGFRVQMLQEVSNLQVEELRRGYLSSRGMFCPGDYRVLQHASQQRRRGLSQVSNCSKVDHIEAYIISNTGFVILNIQSASSL